MSVTTTQGAGRFLLLPDSCTPTIRKLVKRMPENRMRELRRLICILASAIYARVNTSAQEIAGSLRGTIRDASGGAGDDGLTRPLSSRRVAGGHDRLEAAAKGFKKYVQERGVLQHFQLR
jgi:hypothetical protein